MLLTSYPLPENEADRLRVLQSYDILDTSPEKEFDDIVALAAQIFGVPIAVVSFVAEHRQFLKAAVGRPICDEPREGSFCTYTILSDDVLVVPDASKDPRFAASPFVLGPPYVRFYAGAPLIGEAGAILGTLCLIDLAARPDFSGRDRKLLEYLAGLAMERLEFRRLANLERDSRKQFESIAATSPDAIVCSDEHNVIISWNKAAERMFGYSDVEAIGRTLNLIVPAELRGAHEEGLKRVVAGGKPRRMGASITINACRREGDEFPVELSLSQWTEGGRKRFGAIIRDITDRKHDEARLKRAAEFDSLTDLANRTVLAQHMQGAFEAGIGATVMLLDLDGFKDVNDSLGHAAGDQVLRIVATRLTETVEEQTLVSRLGGDEFVIFIAGTANPVHAAALGERLIAAIEEPIEIGDRSIYIGASGGIALSHGDSEPAALLDEADLALYRAKADGRRRVRIFTPELQRTAAMRTSVSSGMRQAWDRREFELYYQPQVHLASGTVAGAEALLRWNHPERGVVAPGAFLHVLETSLLAVPVSEWILRTGCEQASRWRRHGFPGFRIGINLFAAQFKSNDLPEIVRRALHDFALPPEALELEITENIILQSDDRITCDLKELRAMGVGIAFDDYGTGYASLTMLKDYPVTRLKIDRSFVSGVDRSHKDQTIVEAIAQLAGGFDLDVIAEGIETEEQAALMERYCSEGQGYLFGRPMPATRFEALFGGDGRVSREAAG